MYHLKYLITLPTSTSSALASTSKKCYRCGKQDHYAHQCITLSTTDYLQYRYKFGRLGDVVERVTKSQSQSEDDLYPGYNSDTETKTATTTTTTTNNGRPPLPRGARGARGARGGSSKPRGPRPPRPPPKKRPSIVKKKIKKLSAKQIAAEEKMKAAFDLATQNETKADQDQINKWKNEEKLEVETRTCPRTKRKVRIDMWDAHVSALSAEITSYMYLGGERNAHNHKELTYRTQVGFILNAAWEVGNFYPNEFEYLKLPFQDFKDQAGALAKDLNKSVDFIDRARSYGSKVLVHCVAGISRSSTICIHYLIRREKWTLKKAYMHVLKLRALIRPNIGFFKELRRVEKEEFGMNSMSLAEWEQLEEGQIKIASFA